MSSQPMAPASLSQAGPCNQRQLWKTLHPLILHLRPKYQNDAVPFRFEKCVLLTMSWIILTFFAGAQEFDFLIIRGNEDFSYTAQTTTWN